MPPVTLPCPWTETCGKLPYGSHLQINDVSVGAVCLSGRVIVFIRAKHPDVGSEEEEAEAGERAWRGVELASALLQPRRGREAATRHLGCHATYDCRLRVCVAITWRRRS